MIGSTQNMSQYKDFGDERIKHLQLIQDVISRLGTDGFLVKGWALTVAGIFLGFAVNSNDAWLAFASLFPTLVFWGLDGYFLRAERLFRALYERIRKRTDYVPPFFMGATAPSFINLLRDEEKQQHSWWRTLRRPSLLFFYVSILFSTLAVIGVVLTVVPTNPSVPHIAKTPSTAP